MINKLLRPLLLSIALLILSSPASAQLLGVGPQIGVPDTLFNNTGTTNYNAGNGRFSVQATPLATLFVVGDPRVDFDPNQPRSLTFAFELDGAGIVVGGVPGDDFVMTGTVGAFSGVLLTGEIVEFGFLNLGTTDFYDARFRLTGGMFAPLFAAGKDIGVAWSSENSTFNGSFLVSFGGAAKGNNGPIPAECVELEKQVSVIPLADLTNDQLFGDDPSIWFDADTFDTGPGTDLGATYRLVVENCGDVDLVNVNLEDVQPSSLPPNFETIMFNVNIGDLAVGEQKVIVSSAVGDPNVLSTINGGNPTESFIDGFDDLDAPERCEDPAEPIPGVPDGKLLNTARASTPGGGMDEDPAWVMCQPEPDIELKKQVSVIPLADLTNDQLFGDDPAIWFDADTFPTGPNTALGATYRLVVVNTGTVPLTNVTLEDVQPSSLPPGFETILFDVNIGDLAVGEQKVIVSSKVGLPNVLSTINGGNPTGTFIDGFDDLDAPERCLDPAEPIPGVPDGKLLNTARVTTDQGPMDDNPAWVMCQPDIELKKQVSVIPLAELEANGDLFVDDPSIWFDADTFPAGPTTALGATYRLVVVNTGTVPLTNVTLEDVQPSSLPPNFETILFNVNIGDLAVGEQKVIVSSTVGFPNVLSTINGGNPTGTFLDGFDDLDAPERCLDPAVPIPGVPDGKLLNTAQVTTDQGPMDDNPAWVMCQPDIELKKQVSVIPLAELEASGDLFVDDPSIWFDADIFEDGPTTDLGATYRLVVKNTGTVPLTNVTLEDVQPSSLPPNFETIMFNVNIGDLAVGEQKVIVSSEVGGPNVESDQTGPETIGGFDDLNAPERCLDPAVPIPNVPDSKLLNTARVSTDQGPTDDNPAWVMCVEPDPGIRIQKKTDSPDNRNPIVPTVNNEDSQNGPGVPIVKPGEPVTWTYRVTNTGNVAFTEAEVLVSDSVASVDVVITFNPNSDNGQPAGIANNGLLDPGEVWVYTAEGTALNLLDPNVQANPPDGVVIVDGCDGTDDDNSPGVTKTYQNLGKVEIDGTDLVDTDKSHYCNPGIELEKTTDSPDNVNTTDSDFDNEDDPNGPGVPVIPVSSDVTWTYKVTNTGGQAFDEVDVFVTDSVDAVDPKFDSVAVGNDDDVLEPGEVWLYTAQGTSLDLPALPTPPGGGRVIVDGCENSVGAPPGGTDTYMNAGTVVTDGLTDSDDSHYCNPPPPVCDINVTKTCVIPEPPVNTLPGKCSGKVQEFTLIWPNSQGPITLSQVDGLSFSQSQVQPGDEVTFFNTGDDNDVFVNISGSGVNGQSKFHLSCSDDDMNADDDNDVQQQVSPLGQDCGKFAGNAKGNESSFINAWIFEGLVDDDNLELDCTAPPDFPTETEECVFTPPPPDTGLECSDIKDITELTMVWDGNGQVQVTPGDGVATVSPSTVNPGDVMTIDVANNASNDIFINVSGAASGESKFHISCSDKDMNANDDNEDQVQVPSMSRDCGKFQGNAKSTSGFVNQWLYAGMAGEGGVITCPDMPGGAGSSTDVIYGITVENPNDEAITVDIVDTLLGINQTEVIPANDTFELVTDPIPITPDGTGTDDPFDPDVFKNTVVVTGTTVLSGAICEDMDMVRVKRNPPPPGPPLLGKCDGKLQEVLVYWNGTGSIDVSAGDGVASLSTDQLNTDDLLTIFTDGSTNDVFVNITGSVSGESKFHVSCSDDDMNADNDNDAQQQLQGESQDCGKFQGDAKDNGDPAFINDWLLEGMLDKEGLRLTCNFDPTTVLAQSLSQSQRSSGGPGGGTVTGASTIELHDDAIKWELTNGGSSDVYITEIEVIWPDGFNEHDQLREMKLDGAFVKDLDDNFPAIADSSPTVIGEGDGIFKDEGAPDERVLKDGDTKKLEIKFTEKYKEEDGKTEADFSIRVVFSNGDELTF